MKKIVALVAMVLALMLGSAPAFAAPSFCFDYSVDRGGGQVKLLYPADEAGLEIRFSSAGPLGATGEIAAVGPCDTDMGYMTCEMQGAGYYQPIAQLPEVVDSPVIFEFLPEGQKGEKGSNGKLSIEQFWGPNGAVYLYETDCE
ncbi:MAG: hypothetical protein J7647_08085 [Cyanobacteria bacterium SBLK]|nr:hypothetical protein [Cyanobacteria bacterium SBLK]